MAYKWYILPIGGLYITYHLLREPGNSIDLRIIFLLPSLCIREVGDGRAQIHLIPVPSWELIHIPRKKGNFESMIILFPKVGHVSEGFFLMFTNLFCTAILDKDVMKPQSCYPNMDRFGASTVTPDS